MLCFVAAVLSSEALEIAVKLDVDLLLIVSTHCLFL